MSATTAAEIEDVTGVILAGGLSRRMGGGDKGLLALGGDSMLAHVVRRLSPQVSRVVLNANGEPARFRSLGLPVVADTIDGFVGPLAGVLAGMRWSRAHAREADYVVSVSADAPFLPADLVGRLGAALRDRPRAIALGRSAGEIHPVIGLWPVALADDLEVELRRGVRKVLNWTDKHGTIAVDFPMQVWGNETIDPFFNANTPTELDEARRLLALMGA